jgi:hypothetical protein
MQILWHSDRQLFRLHDLSKRTWHPSQLFSQVISNDVMAALNRHATVGS